MLKLIIKKKYSVKITSLLSGGDDYELTFYKLPSNDMKKSKASLKKIELKLLKLVELLIKRLYFY